MLMMDRIYFRHSRDSFGLCLGPKKKRNSNLKSLTGLALFLDSMSWDLDEVCLRLYDIDNPTTSFPQTSYWFGGPKVKTFGVVHTLLIDFFNAHVTESFQVISHAYGSKFRAPSSCQMLIATGPRHPIIYRPSIHIQ